MTSAAFDAWVQRAKAVRIEDELKRRTIRLNGNKVERCGPCPVCRGTDRFSINIEKRVWNCRGCGKGGGIIDLVEHLDGVDFVRAVEKLTGEPAPKANGKDRSGTARKVVAAEYPYEDEVGALVFVVERIEYKNADGSFVLKDGKRKKTFRQKRPDKSGGWIWNVDGVPALPYRLPELLEALGADRPILIVEGEAKADLLWSWRVPATTCAKGAEKWKPEHSAFLRGAEVVILPDDDATGRKHMDVVATSLADVAASVRVLKLPGLPPKGDVIDWAKAGGTVEQLHQLIERDAKPWSAENSATEDPRAPEHSDDALALLFAERHANDLRFVAFRARWMFWDVWRWSIDGTLRAFDCARRICREQAQGAKRRIASALASAKTVAAVERLAKADRRIAAEVEQFDADPENFNTPAQEQTS
jgi:putative DNA primase/helicase